MKRVSGIGLALVGEGEPAGDHRVIGGGQRIGLGRQLAAEGEVGAAMPLELAKQFGIVGGVGDDRDKFMVLGRRADHRRAADVDILDDLVARRALRDGRLERVEVDDDQVDRADAMRLHRRDMFGIVAHREQAAMDLRVERLHPAVHHLRKAGKFANVTDFMTKFAQLGGGAAGRDQLDACLREACASSSSPALSESEMSARRMGTIPVMMDPLGLA